MVDTYTPLLRIVQMATGSNDTLWGEKANAAFAMLEQAIDGAAAISITAGNVTLTENDNAADQARLATLNFTGTPGATRTITVPDLTKTTLIINTSDSSVILTTGGSGDTATVEPEQVGFMFSDGADNVYFFLMRDVEGHGVLAQVYSATAL